MNGGSGVDTIIAIDGGVRSTSSRRAVGTISFGRAIWSGFRRRRGLRDGDVIHDVDGFDNPGADLTLDGDLIPLPEPLPRRRLREVHQPAALLPTARASSTSTRVLWAIASSWPA